MNTRLNRRLAAILSLDVVGFSRLMGEDEEGTLSTLKKCHAEIINPAIESFGGRIFKLMGDGALAEFGSVVGAVECAVNILNQVNSCDQVGTGKMSIQFRIGINLGDVIIDADDIYGDGVNVASRIEALADPGGICVSGSVYDQIHQKLELDFKAMGRQSLKNIKEPVRVYKIHRTGRSEDTSSATAVMSEMPSIAVLPFVSLGTDPEQDYFSDGISEDIISGLGKLNGLKVIAKSSTFVYKNQTVDIRQVGLEQGVRYVLEGSVRRSGNRVRVTAQLNDTSNGHQIWSEKFDREIDDIFNLQDELMREIVVALDVKINEGDQARFWASGTQNVEAWECLRQSSPIILNSVSDQLPHAKKLLERALELDPDYAIAWAMLGWYHQNFVDVAGLINKATESEDSLSAMKRCADKAIQIDPKCADAYSVLSMYHLELRDFDAASEYAEQSIALAPSNAENMMESVQVLAKTGHPHRALDLAKRAKELCPILRTGYLRGLALAHRLIGNLETAAELYRDAVKGQPNHMSGYVNLASVLGEQGLIDEANQIAQIVLTNKPDFSIEEYSKSLCYRNREDLDRVVEGLRAAGLN